MRKFHSLKLIGLVSILTVALVFIGFNLLQAQAQGKGKKGNPPGKGKEEEGPSKLVLANYNIVTAQPDYDGYLQVFGDDEGNYSYEKIWSEKDANYGSVAIGDVDNDGWNEIVVPYSYCASKVKGECIYHIHINVYRQGVSGVWKKSVDFIEEDNHWFFEITTADINGDNDKEIVLITENGLAVFDYIEGEFKKIGSYDFSTRLASVTTGNIDDDSFNEIVVSGAKGDLYIFEDSELSSPSTVNANLTSKSLRIGDIDSDDKMEICSTGYRKLGDLYESYIFIWGAGDRVYSEGPYEYKVGTSSDWPYMHLDVGELGYNLGEEVALSSLNPDTLYILSWDGSKSALDSVCSINPENVYHPDYNIKMDHVYIADTNGDALNEVIAAGSALKKGKTKGPNKSGVFYLEIFDSDLISKWHRLLGEKGEGGVWSAAIGKK